MLNIYGSLGATEPSAADAQAWASYIGAAGKDVQAVWEATKSSYLTLKNIRKSLGLPFIGGPVGEGGPDEGAWSQDLEVHIQDLQAMAKVLVDAANDVTSGKRKMFFDTKTSQIGIEGKPGDVVRLAEDGSGSPVLISAATGYPTHVQGTVGVPLLVFGAIAAGAVVSHVGLYLLAKQALHTVQNVSQDKTQRTLATNQTKQIELGATPAEAKANTDSILKGSADLEKARAEKEKASGDETKTLASTLTKLAYVGLAGGVIYAVLRMLPPLPASVWERKGAPARLQLNPRRMPQRGYGFISRASNWRTAKDDTWEIEIIDRYVINEYLGTRSIDGTKSDVWRAKRPDGPYVFLAQTSLGKA